MEFKGNLIRGPQTCEECSAFHEVRRQSYVDGVKRDVIFYECWGVSEPFEVSEYQRKQPCSQYENKYSQVNFSSLEEFINLLTESERKNLLKILEDKVK